MARPPLIEVPVLPPHNMLYPATFEFDAPWVSRVNVKGGLVGFVMVKELLEPVAYGPPEAMTAPNELVIVQVVSSRLLPLNTLTVMGPVKPPDAVAVPFKTVDVCPPQSVTSGPAFTVGNGLTYTVT
jgi:hypothetical protein